MSNQTDLQALLKEFAQFLGEQDKQMKAALVSGIATAKTEAVEASGLAADAKIVNAKGELQTAIQQAVSALKTELVNGASEELDTFKELADELARLKASGSEAPEALLAKITEAKQLAEGVKAKIEGLDLQQMKDAYTTAAA